MFQDLRYAARTLLKDKGFTAVAVACLALGIGVNATIFSVVDGVIIQPFPYPFVEGLVDLHSSNPQRQLFRGGISYKDYEDWREGRPVRSRNAES